MSTAHIALLRGINVGGHRPVGMPALKAAFGALGYAEVQTYLQSGNVIFRAGSPDRQDIETALEQTFGFPVEVMLRSAEEWQALTDRNPYPEPAAADPTRVHVAFLHAPPDPARVAAVRARPGNVWQAMGRELYLHLPGGLGQSDLNLAPLKQPATVRNWRTVLELGKRLRPS